LADRFATQSTVPSRRFYQMASLWRLVTAQPTTSVSAGSGRRLRGLSALAAWAVLRSRTPSLASSGAHQRGGNHPNLPGVSQMNKNDLTEADIRSKFITPALVGVSGAKWNLMTQIREEVLFTNGRVIVRRIHWL
jgi:hypothetical protein